MRLFHGTTKRGARAALQHGLKANPELTFQRMKFREERFREEGDPPWNEPELRRYAQGSFESRLIFLTDDLDIAMDYASDMEGQITGTVLEVNLPKHWPLIGAIEDVSGEYYSSLAIPPRYIKKLEL